MLYEDNDYLVHYGIKGQRWGIRSFQNKDGTLTEEGKKRYGSDSRKSDLVGESTYKENEFESSAFKLADHGCSVFYLQYDLIKIGHYLSLLYEA